ncbi:MAG: SusC/RagA family TonB-linked outer membrane protein [Salinibacter sp.]
MLRKVLTVLILLALPATALAQDTGTIAGTVVDSTTSEPLPGVNVTVQGLNIGAATGANGQFEISGVPAGEQTLIASYVGYARKNLSVEVEAGQTTNVNVRMAPKAVGLQDVVVTALGVERSQRAVTTAVQEIEASDVNKTPTDNFISSLQGKVAGASIRTSNVMGGSNNIVLRGYSSITGNNQPLIVVDGIVINNRRGTNSANQNEGNGGFDFGNAASTISPSNIKSISVLKGAAAAALYGSRGANGVIQITTKDGSGQEGLGVSFSSEVQFTKAYNFMDYQNKYGGGSSTAFRTLDGDYRADDQYVAAYAIDESFGPRLDGRKVRQWYSWDNVNGLKGQATPWVAHPDAVEDFLRTATTYNNNLAVSNSGESYNFRLSLSTKNEQSVMPNGNLENYETQFNGTVDVSENLSATAFVRYSYRDVKARSGTGYGFEENPFAAFNTFTQRQLDYGPDSYMRDYERPNGQQRGWNYLGIAGAQNPTTFNFTDNPYVNRYENYETDDRQRVFGKAKISYDFTDALSGQAQVTTDHYTERRGDRTVQLSTEDPPGYSETTLEVQEINGEVRFDYSSDLTSNISLSAFGAGKVRYETFENFSASTSGGLSAPGVYTVENSVGRPNVNDYFEEKMVYSVYGSANVGYNQLVYLEGTIRNDWSSTLPADNNSFLYPSISGNLIFTELEALQGQDILSYGKIRASWAQVGNDTDPYQLGATFPLGTPFKGQPLQNVQRNSPNPNLKPEETTSIEVGANLEFFDSRIKLNTTYYRKVTRNQILQIGVSSASGFNQALVNAGEVQNRGLEASLTVTPIQTGSAQWDLTANFNKNVNEVVDLAKGIDTYVLDDAVFGPNAVAKEGQAYGALTGPKVLRDASGDIVYSRAGVPRTTNENKTVGNFQPDWTGGISTTFSYKNLTVDATVSGQMGGSVFSVSNMFGQYSGLIQSTVTGNQRQTYVIPDGVVLPKGTDPSNASNVEGTPYEKAVKTPRMPPGTFYKFAFSGRMSHYTYDATHFKLSGVSLTYSLPQKWLSDLPLQQANVSVTGSNLLFLYKEAPNIDPGVTLGAGNLQGFEAGQIPTQRTYGFRVNLKF